MELDTLVVWLFCCLYALANRISIDIIKKLNRVSAIFHFSLFTFHFSLKKNHHVHRVIGWNKIITII